MAMSKDAPPRWPLAPDTSSSITRLRRLAVHAAGGSLDAVSSTRAASKAPSLKYPGRFALVRRRRLLRWAGAVRAAARSAAQVGRVQVDASMMSVSA